MLESWESWLRVRTAEVIVLHLSISLVGALKVVSIRRGLLQGCVWDVHLFTGIYVWLEKVRHEEDLQDKAGEF